MIVAISDQDIKYGQAILHTMSPEAREQGYQELKELEEEDYPEAGVALGQYYLNRDKTRARKYFEFAAEYDVGEGFWGLAQTINRSSLLNLNNTTDRRWFRCVSEAANRSSVSAMMELAHAYQELGSYCGGAYWYQKAKLYGHEDAAFQLELLVELWKGAGCPSEPAELPEEFTALQKEAGNLILHLYSGSGDYETVYQLTQTALKEEPVAELTLAYIYESSDNLSNAGKIYRIATTHEEPFAMRRSGDMHLAGSGMYQNTDRAMKMYQDAAAAGERTAMFELGKCADAFEQDKEKMAYWYACAHVRGYPEASNELRKLIYK